MVQALKTSMVGAPYPVLRKDRPRIMKHFHVCLLDFFYNRWNVNHSITMSFPVSTLGEVVAKRRQRVSNCNGYSLGDVLPIPFQESQILGCNAASRAHLQNFGPTRMATIPAVTKFLLAVRLNFNFSHLLWATRCLLYVISDFDLRFVMMLQFRTVCLIYVKPSA